MKKLAPPVPLKGWTAVAIFPEADIVIDDGETSSTDKKALVDSFITVLDDHGVAARRATADDKRRINLSITVMRGRSRFIYPSYPTSGDGIL